jgi:hypothetical protein
MRRTHHEWSPKAHGLDTECQQPQRVSTVPHAAVSVDLDLLEDAGVLAVDLEGDLEAGGGAVELATAVVGEDDAGDFVLDGEAGVFDGGDALEDDGEFGEGADFAVVVPLARE